MTAGRERGALTEKPAHKVFFFLVFAFCLFAYVHEVCRMAVFSHSGDFGNYYFYCKAARLGYPVYSLNEAAFASLGREFGMPQYVHPTFHAPSFFLAFNWISFLDFRTAALLWLLLNNLLVAASAAMLFKLAVRHIGGGAQDKKFFIASSLVFIALFQPLFEGLFLGQISVFVLFFLCLGLYLLDKDRHYAAGIMFALGLMIKPHLLLILLFFPWKRCWRVFFSAVAALGIIETLSILSWPALELRYWTVEAPSYFAHRAIILASPDNYSFPALVHRMAAFPVLQRPALVFSWLCSLGLLLFILRRTRGRFTGVNRRFLLDFSLFLMAPLVVFMLTHEHHYILLLIPLVFAWAALQKEYRYGGLFIAAFLLLGSRYNLIQFPAFSQGPAALFTGLKLSGLLILLFLTFRLQGRGHA